MFTVLYIYFIFSNDLLCLHHAHVGHVRGFYVFYIYLYLFQGCTLPASCSCISDINVLYIFFQGCTSRASCSCLLCLFQGCTLPASCSCLLCLFQGCTLPASCSCVPCRLCLRCWCWTITTEHQTHTPCQDGWVQEKTTANINKECLLAINFSIF